MLGELTEYVALRVRELDRQQQTLGALDRVRVWGTVFVEQLRGNGMSRETEATGCKMQTRVRACYPRNL